MCVSLLLEQPPRILGKPRKFRAIQKRFSSVKLLSLTCMYVCMYVCISWDNSGQLGTTQDNSGTTRGQLGDNSGTTWGQLGTTQDNSGQLRKTRGQLGDNSGTTRGQLGDNSGTTRDNSGQLRFDIKLESTTEHAPEVNQFLSHFGARSWTTCMSVHFALTSVG